MADYDAQGLALKSLSVLGGIRPGSDLLERFIREGEYYSQVTNNYAAPTATATGAINTVIVGLNTGLPTIGKAVYVTRITATLDTAALAQLALAPDLNSRFTGLYDQTLVQAFQPIVIAPNRIFRAFEVQNGVISIAVRNNLTAGAVTYKGAVAVHGHKVTDDFNYGADRTILFAGDSILNGTGPTTTARMWPTIVRTALAQASGKTARMVLKSVSGSTSSDHELWRAGGYHDIQRVDMGLYALSVNDAVTATATTTYLANITAYWTWWAKRYPNTVLVVCGTTPLENNTQETAAAALRGAASAYVASVASPWLKFVDLGGSFDRTQGLTFYAASDTAGSRVHPNDAGHAAVATTMLAGLAAQGLSLILA